MHLDVHTYAYICAHSRTHTHIQIRTVRSKIATDGYGASDPLNSERNEDE